ncbi:MAG TPA: AraC family transcriptional regulator [Flavobacteriales bacterium]|nr:AraC family transcriptional regulator [Flavobacteriales bacterium]
MGIRIIHQQNLVTVTEPFTPRDGASVQFVANLELHKHNLMYTPGRKKKQEMQPDFSVEFSVGAFRTLAKTGNNTLKEFAKKCQGNKQVAFVDLSLTIDAPMHQCIYSMLNYAGEETLKPLFMQARVIELMWLQQNSFILANTLQPKYVKSDYDKERIIFARDYLLTHMDSPPTLIQLAAIAGINEFKLKRGFKEVFNQTVFGYLANVRLDMAKTALRQKQKPVTQIAFELGYASLQHFSMAFKKKFGVSPVKFN